MLFKKKYRVWGLPFGFDFLPREKSNIRGKPAADGSCGCIRIKTSVSDPIIYRLHDHERRTAVIKFHRITVGQTSAVQGETFIGVILETPSLILENLREFEAIRWFHIGLVNFHRVINESGVFGVFSVILDMPRLIPEMPRLSTTSFWDRIDVINSHWVTDETDIFGAILGTPRSISEMSRLSAMFCRGCIVINFHRDTDEADIFNEILATPGLI
jgi:hypothetical protein